MEIFGVSQFSRALVPTLGAALCAFSVGCSTDNTVAGGSVDGPSIYKDACSRCHGLSGVPTKGMQARAGVKPLTSSRVAAMSDVDIAKQIRNGSKNRMMPAFQGAITDEQIQALVAHIRTLSQVSGKL